MSASGELNLAFDILLGSLGKNLSADEAEAVRSAFEQAVGQSRGYASAVTADFHRYQQLFDGRHFKSQAASTLKEPSVVVLNELANHIRYLAAWLTDRVPRLRVFPASARTSAEAAQLMKRVLTTYFIGQRMKLVLRQAYQDALVFGSGFVRYFWDPFADQAMGALTSEVIAPHNVFPAEGMDDIRDGPYFVVRRYVDPFEASRAKSKQLSEGAAFLDDDYDWRSARAQGGVQIGQYTTVETRPFFTTSSKEPNLEEGKGHLKEVFDIWLKKEDVYGTRWIKVTSDFEFIYTPIEIYSELPFAHYRFQQIRARRFYGQGLAEILYFPQRVLDEVTSMINHQIHFTADPIWIEEAGARDLGRPGKRKLKAGQVIFVQDGYRGRIGYEAPPPLQQAQFEMISLMLSYFERVTGMSAYMRGMTPARRELVGVVDALAEASQVLVRSASEDFEYQTEAALSGAAAIVATQLIQGRRLYLIEDESPDLYLDIPDWPFYEAGEGSQPMQFKVHFESGSSMAISRERRAAEAFRFYQATNGMMGPEWLARELGIDGAAEVVASAITKHDERQMMLQQSVQQAAAAVEQAAMTLIGGNNADNQTGRVGETGFGNRQEIREGQGLDWRQGGPLPEGLREQIEALANATAGSQIPPSDANIPGIGGSPGGNVPA